MATEEHLSDKKNDYKKIYEKYKQSTKEDLFFFLHSQKCQVLIL